MCHGCVFEELIRSSSRSSFPPHWKSPVLCQQDCLQRGQRSWTLFARHPPQHLSCPLRSLPFSLLTLPAACAAQTTGTAGRKTLTREWLERGDRRDLSRAISMRPRCGTSRTPPPRPFLPRPWSMQDAQTYLNLNGIIRIRMLFGQRRWRLNCYSCRGLRSTVGTNFLPEQGWLHPGRA